MVKITLRVPQLTFDSLAYFAVFAFVIYLVYKNYFKKPNQNYSNSNYQNATEDDDRPKLTVLYGSQTGTAEGFANNFAKEAAQNFGFNAKPVDLADYENPEDLPNEGLVTFIMATYGEGEPTDSAREFWDFLMEKQDPGFLKKLKYTVFGLGNEQYKIYQAAGRGVDKRVAELGAERIFERGEGNADGTMDEDWEEWKAKVLPTLANMFGTQVNEDTTVAKQYEIEYVASRPPATPFKPPVVNGGKVDQKHPAMARIKANSELLNSDARSTRHIEVDISKFNIEYEAGDHLGVYAKNDNDLVLEHARYFGVEDQLDNVFTLNSSNPEELGLFPHECQTLRMAFEYYLDLTTKAKKQFLKALLSYVTDESQKTRLQEICDSKEQYHKYIVEAERIPIEVLRDFDSASMPIEHFMELMPRLQPRYYSIASSSKEHPDSIHIVVAVVKYTTPLGRNANGVCSTHLQNLSKGSLCPVFVRHSNFHLPSKLATPSIFIGPGTGVAPFIGFLQQRRASKEQEGQPLGQCTMYFGCRRRSEDYIYATEMESAVRDGVISKLEVAFSREQETKDYVQHHVKADSAEIWDYISKGGYIYVCGDAKYMAKDVDRALAEIVHEHGNMTLEDASKFVDDLTTKGRYLRDVWSP